MQNGEKNVVKILEHLLYLNVFSGFNSFAANVDGWLPLQAV